MFYVVKAEGATRLPGGLQPAAEMAANGPNCRHIPYGGLSRKLQFNGCIFPVEMNVDRMAFRQQRSILSTKAPSIWCEEACLSVLERNNVRVAGTGKRAMIFAHGFGCDQNMWRLVAPAFAGEFTTILFDHVGAGSSDLAAYDPAKYGQLQGYADDLVEICRTLGLKDAVFVGHSVSAMIGVLASLSDPTIFAALVLVGPSPRYINDGAYVGGFGASDIDDLLEALADNHLGWSAMMAPVIIGNPDRPELGTELTNSFCRTDPAIAKDFARVTFTSDNRADLTGVTARTLILQCREDAIAPQQVGEYVRDHIPGSQLILLDATGHCPNLSAPEEVIAAIRSFV